MIRRYPSIFLLVFIVAGILLADLTRLSGWLLFSASLFSCFLGFWLLRRGGQWPAPIMLSLSLLFFSAFHYAARYYEHGPQHITNFLETPGTYHIFGRVSDWPDLKADRTEIKISVDSIADSKCHRVHGAVLLRVTDTTTALQRGDRVEFYGRLYPLREGGYATGFDYRRFLNLKGVFGTVYVSTLLDVRVDRGNPWAPIPIVDKLRSAIRESLYRNLSPTGAALASGFLIGETRNIPTHLYHRFRDSGTLHLLAVSGSNVALVLLFLVVVMRPLALSPHKRAGALLAAVGVFALLSYGEPSVLRAAVMASLVILAGVLQRRHDLNNIIAAAAVIILLIDPAQLFDVGFLLSFTIAWGLIYTLPRIAVYFKPVQNRWWYRFLIFPFLISLVAQICSTGIIAFYFGRIPLISPVANLIVVPLVSAAVIGILIVLVADLILPLLGALLGAWLNLLLNLIISAVDGLGSERIPSASISDLSVWLVVVFYIFLFAAIWSLSAIRLRRVVVFLAVIGVNLFLLTSVLRTASGPRSSELTLVSVPGGVAAVLTRPDGAPADLVITSLMSRRYPVDERILMPYLNRLDVGSLDAVFVLSADYGAVDDLLKLCRQYSARHLYVSYDLESSFREIMARQFYDDSGLELITLKAGSGDFGLSAGVYQSTRSGLVLCLPEEVIEFCSCLESRYLQPLPTAVRRFVVAGSLWRTTDEELVHLAELGVNRIFCSKIVQPLPEESADAPAGEPPVDVIDLSRLGSVKVPIHGL